MFTSIVFLIDNSSQLGNWMLLAVAYLVGKRMVKGRPEAQARGRAAAGLAFTAYVGAAIYTYGQPDSMLLADIIYRGVLSAGVVLGFAWMALATVDIALSPAIGHVRYRIATLERWWRLQKDLRAQQRREREWLELEKHRITEENRPETEQERQDRLAREKRAEEEAKRERERLTERAKIGRLKDRIRYEANLLHKKKLRPGKTYKRKDFDDLLDRVLESDDQEQIEARSAQLFSSLGGQLTGSSNTVEEESLEQLAAAYEERRRAVQAMQGVDDEYKSFLITAINREEGQAVQRRLSKMKYG